MKAVPNIKIDRATYNRGKQDIQSWLSSWLGAESKSNPKRQKLIDLYEWLMIDGHLKAVTKNRKSKLLGEDFGFYNKETGEENLELKKLFHKKRWFRQWRNMALDARFFGFSLIEVYEQKVDSYEVKIVKSIERRNVLVDRQEVAAKPGDNVGIPIVGNEFEPYYTLVDGDDGLGLLLNVAPLIIYKRFSSSSWAGFLEKYGIPIVVLHTDRSADEKTEVANDLDKLGRDGTLAVGQDEKLTIAYPQGAGESYKNFKEMISWCNEEISKMIVGQTMTTDNGSSRAQGEVHERTLEDITEEDMEWLESVTNDDLIPRLVSIGYPAELLDYTFEHAKLRNKRLLELAEQEKKTQEVKNDLFDKVVKLVQTGKYTVEPKFIEDNFGIPVVLVPNTPSGRTPANQKKKSLFPVNKKQITNDLFDDLLDKFLKITLSLAKKLFNGKKPKDIDTDSLTNLTNKTIKQAMSVGMEYDLSKKDTDILRNNIFIFSAAKSYAQLIEMSTLLVDADGNIRTFEEFKKEVEALNIKFNRAWLQTEYQLAVTTTQNITRWQELTDGNPDVLIRYNAVGDGNTTQLCNTLNGVTLPASDPFWKKYTPPNHFNCRSVIQEGEEIKKPGDDLPDIEPIFAFNPANEMQIFSESHPYFNYE